MKYFLLSLFSLILLLILIRRIGIQLNRRTPRNGINTSMFVDINGTKQWISIYGKDNRNPVLLFLHGGPGSPMSYADYVVLRKLAGEYTVVEWDQRNSGKNWEKGRNNGDVTADMLISDGVEMTRFLRHYFDTDKIYLFGISWGSIFGANLALEHPEYYEAVLAASLAVDPSESGTYFKKYMLEAAKNDPEMLALAEKLDPYGDLPAQTKSIILPLAKKYGYSDSLWQSDCSLVAAILFNPYMTLKDWLRFFRTNAYIPSGYHVHQILHDVSLLDRTEYRIPFYVMLGDRDIAFLNMHTCAADYYARVSAPDKELRYVKGGHMMPMLNSKELHAFLKDIRMRTKGRFSG